MSGFDLEEVGPEHLTPLWQRGGLPLSYLAETDEDSAAWRDNFIHTFLERDLGNFGISRPRATSRFWTMLAHSTARSGTPARLAGSLSISNMTARRYLDILQGAYMIRVLPPWHENIKKRQVKSPKVFLQDSGLLHCLLEIRERRTLLGHPKLGASWEGFALDQIVRYFRSAPPISGPPMPAPSWISWRPSRDDGMALSANTATLPPPPVPCTSRWQNCNWNTCLWSIPARRRIPCTRRSRWSRSPGSNPAARGNRPAEPSERQAWNRAIAKS